MDLLDLMERPTVYPFAPGSHTSFKAARALKPRRRGIVTALYLNLLYRKGALSDEQAHARLNLTFRVARSSLSSIRFACMQTGLVRDSGQETTAVSGMSVARWELTEQGRAAQEAGR